VRCVPFKRAVTSWATPTCPAPMCAVLSACYGLHLFHFFIIILICSSLLVSVRFYRWYLLIAAVLIIKVCFFLQVLFRSCLAIWLWYWTSWLLNRTYFRDPSEFYFLTFYVDCDMNYFLFIVLFYHTLHLKRAQSCSRNLLCFFIHFFIHLYIYMRRSVSVHVSSLNILIN